MPLTDDQQKALDIMMQGNDIFVLKGYAGTGKTYLLNTFLQETPSRSVVITATTHKALGVAKGDYTIHSYLGLKLEQGKGTYKLVAGKDRVRKFDLVIVDEASMLNTEILEVLLAAQKDYKLKIIFVGDPAQLPPVKEEISPVWDLDVPSYTLTKIMRQAEGSKIISAATAIREGNCPDMTIRDLADGKDLITGSMKKAQEFFLANYTQDDFPQFISYRNAVVDQLNTWARRQVLNKPEDPYCVGEKVYIRSTAAEAVFRLEDVVRILHIGDVQKLEKGPYAVYYRCLSVIKEEDIGHFDEEELDYYEGSNIFVLCSPGDMVNFGKNKTHLAGLAKTKMGTWKEFWDYSEFPTEIKHIYAMTCHRSQGSTFKKVIVNKADIEENRLFYTAVTRASEQLFIIM